jgi:hypothetical protein
MRVTRALAGVVQVAPLKRRRQATKNDGLPHVQLTSGDLCHKSRNRLKPVLPELWHKPTYGLKPALPGSTA